MRTSTNRTLGFIVAAIVVVGIVFASVASSWTVSERDPKSPEGVVQAYMSAVMDHRIDAALALLEPGTQCTAENYQQAYVDASSRVDLVDVRTSGDSADVHVRIEHSNGDPFGGTWNEDQYLALIRVNGDWRIHGMPYPLYNCGPVVK